MPRGARACSFVLDVPRRSGGRACSSVGIDIDTADREIYEKLHLLDGAALGAVLVRASCSADACDYIGPPQRALRRYWFQTHCASDPMIFLDIVDARTFAEPVQARSATVGGSCWSGAPRQLFRVTPFTKQTCELRRDSNGDDIGAALAAWRQQDCLEDSDIALSVPAAHAILSRARLWPSLAVPWPSNPRSLAQSGLGVLRPVVHGVDMSRAFPIENVLQPNNLEDLANFVRGISADLQ